MKKHIVSLLGVVCLVFAGTHMAEALSVITDGLVAAYEFSGNANDAIGVNHGTVTGATLSSDRFGNAESAYRFDGNGEYIDFGRSPELNFGTQDFAISVWFYAETLTGNYAGDRSILSRWANGSWAWDVRVGWAHEDSTNQVYFGFGDSPGDLIRISDDIVTIDAWHHVVATRNNGVLYGYVDGIAFNAGDQSSHVASGNSDMRISSFEGYFNSGSSSTTGSFDGMIDDVYIYNRGLSQWEVSSLYGTSHPVPEPSTILLFIAGIVGLAGNKIRRRKNR